MGGIENHLYVLSNELKAKVDVEVVVCNTTARTARDEIEGVHVTRCASLMKIASTSIAPTMPFEIGRRPYDVVHVHLPNPMGAASYLASRKPRKHRLVVTYHSDVVRQRRLGSLYAPVVDELLGRADAIVATSPNYLERSVVLQRFAKKCTVVPYGIDLGLYEKTRERETQASAIRARYPGRSLLLAVGRLIYYKGFEHAIRALSLVPDAVLLIAGEGPLRGMLEGVARESGVADRVTFLGDVHNNHIAPYYLASDVYLLPSTAPSEAFGIVQIEALAAGVPVVNTDLPSGVPFVSRDGESGFTVPPGDHHALARAVQKLLEDSALRERFGRAGRARASADFSKEVLVERLVALYEGRAAGAGEGARIRAMP
jgi:rhamnosyl/mannosyltransferase